MSQQLLPRWKRHALALAIVASLVVTGMAAAAPGDLDLSFGSGGITQIDLVPPEGFALVRAVATQPDGKVVAAGYAESADQSFLDIVVVRLARDGTLDESFGSGGKVRTHVGPESVSNFGMDIAVAQDGKIVVGATAGGTFVLVRYNRDGSPDGSFGLDGVVTTFFGRSNRGDFLRAIAIQTDGKIVAVGQSGATAPNQIPDPFNATVDNFAIARYNRDGSLDSTFGNTGTVLTDFGSLDFALDVAIQRDGKLVVAGGGSAWPTAKFIIARYTVNGSLDSSFGASGAVVRDFGDGGYADELALQPDGRILADVTTRGLVRLLPDGAEDTTFGSNGAVPDQIVAAGILIRPNTKIVLAGDGQNGWTLIGYTSDGALDTSFGESGSVTTTFPGHDFAHMSDATLQLDGKIVGAGYVSGNGSPSTPTFARWTAH
jgi:uncharacterized delta-60 repeat protein